MSWRAVNEYDESDDDVLEAARDESENSDADDDVDAAGEADRLGVNDEGDDCGLAYHLMFEDENGPFRSLFPGDYEEDDLSSLPVLTDVLPPPSVPAPLAPPPSRPVIAVERADAGKIIKTSDSPATLFMAKQAAVLFPLEKDVNRKRLLEVFAADEVLSAVSPDSLNVGYICSEPVGLGIACVSDEQTRNVLLSRLPGSRLSTKDDLRPFYREKRVKGDAVIDHRAEQTADPVGPVPKKAKASSSLLNRMNDPASLAEAVEQAGGIDQCKFLAIDVEAAVVRERAVPLPLEISLVGCGKLFGMGRFHWFTHPGFVEDEYTAQRLSSCCAGVGHAIPFKHAAFLRKDYPNMAWELHELLSVPGTILINKGSTMDLHALHFVYAVADRFKDDGAVPEIPTIHMFDVSALEALFPQAAAAEVTNEEDAAGDALAELKLRGECWYHRRMSEAVVEFLDITNRRPHCAQSDATELAARIGRSLQRAGSYRTVGQ